MDSFVVIALSSIKGIGAKTLVKCRESLKQWVLNEPQDILEILRQLVSEGKIPTKFTDVSSKEAEEAFQKTAGIFADMEEKGIKVVTLLESTYPEGFHELNRPPVAIYFRGSTDLLTRKGIAIVGTRKASGAGISWAEENAKRAAEKGFVVVSGLALGIDSAAHNGVINSVNPSNTIAILPCGVDKAYPARHKELAERIVGRGGLLISEYIPGVGAEKHNFVERDRLIAALSKAIVAVECSSKSGTMITMSYGYKLKRKLFVVKHSNEDAKELSIEGLEKAVFDYRAIWIDQIDKALISI